MALHTYGTNAGRLGAAGRLRPAAHASGSPARRRSCERSELGALLCFDMANIRYITATHIGTWAMDKLIRFCLLPQDDEPIMWDFGSAARHHKLYNPWLGEEALAAGISTLRGAMSPGRAEAVAAQDPRASSRSAACWASRSAST